MCVRLYTTIKVLKITNSYFYCFFFFHTITPFLYNWLITKDELSISNHELIDGEAKHMRQRKDGATAIFKWSAPRTRKRKPEIVGESFPILD